MNRWLVLVVFLEPEPVSVPKRVGGREYLSFNVVKLGVSKNFMSKVRAKAI